MLTLKQVSLVFSLNCLQSLALLLPVERIATPFGQQSLKKLFQYYIYIQAG